MNKKVRYVLYAVITVICVIAIFVGVVTLELKDEGNENANQGENEVEIAETTDRQAFLNLFNNEFNSSNYDESKIEKADPNKEIVFDAISMKETKGNYDIDVNIPQINIKSDLANSYNMQTQQIFVNKVSEILNSNGSSNSNDSNNTSENNNNTSDTNNADNTNNLSENSNSTNESQENSSNNEAEANSTSNETSNDSAQKDNLIVCNISYTGYINNNILSLAIKEELKEGNDQQRIMIQTYNYNLDTNQEVKIDDIIQQRGLEKDAIQNKINEEIDNMIKDEETMKASGYEIYNRDKNSDMYKVENISVFIEGANGELYIIYPYGNITPTTSLDVVKI